MKKIVVTLWMLFGIYMLVLFVILADLWSGVRKAKKMELLGQAMESNEPLIKLQDIITYYLPSSLLMSCRWFQYGI